MKNNTSKESHENGKPANRMRELLPIPEQYTVPCEHPGTLKTLRIPDYSDATVYLPFGYEKGELHYPTFYLLHGGGGDEHSFFSEDGVLKNMLDHMIEAKELKPLIVVAPTYYPPGKKIEGVEYATEVVRDFGPLLQSRIVQYVEKKYRTGGDRMKRGIGGFSMGAVATWFVMLAGLEQFHWFLVMSGDCWICGEMGGGKHPKQTAEVMAATLRGEKYKAFVVTGDQDIAFPNLDPQMQAMKAIPDVYRKNVKYTVMKGGVHDYPDMRRYLYNFLPKLFK